MPVTACEFKSHPAYIESDDDSLRAILRSRLAIGASSLDDAPTNDLDYTMIVRPNAKLNLGLFVTGRRSDGYHLLETVFLPIPLYDELELTFDPKGIDEDQLEVVGVVDTGRLEDNLVLRAVRLLREQASFPPVRLRLTKYIPSGAGMGGGSADASFTLTALNEMAGLGLSTESLEALALRLGADCPLFVRNLPALGEGIGEVLSPLGLPQLSGLYLTLVKPSLHIATAEAFRGLQGFHRPARPLPELLALPLEQWREFVTNDFELSLFPLYPELREIKESLYACGADFALMTGSGATIYALSRRPLDTQALASPDRFLWQGLLP